MASIRKRGSSWHVQVRKAGFPTLTRTFDSKDAAAQWSRDQERSIDRGDVEPSAHRLKDIVVHDLLQRYEDTVTCSKRSPDQERSKLAVLRRHLPASLPLSRLTSAVIANYRDFRLAVVQSGTVRRELAVLRHCLEVARKEWGVPLSRNPVAGIAIPPAGKGRQRRLEPEDCERLNHALKSAKAWYLRPMIELAIETGMRRGELLQLEWSNVDFVRNLALLKVTKNGDSRSVPLSSKAIAILNGLPKPERRVFPIKPCTVRQAWVRLMERAGIEDLRLHDLRHEAISRFFELGLSVPEVALISGHKDSRMLFRYTHIRPEDVAKKLR
ncbi:site-specific integrase [Kaistia terrae]|nr:site-specific integrase [Kaistia terrae]MCX5580965.1 site-specific integrase [Kaistia terrae]